MSADQKNKKEQGNQKKRKRRVYEFVGRESENVVSGMSASRPTSPTRMNRDMLWHVLYDDDMELMRCITLKSARRMEAFSAGKSEIINIVEKCDSLTTMRCLFFLLLNVDDSMRADVCCPVFCSKVWTSHGSPVPLEGYKATRFFQDFGVQCIHSWIRNEMKSTTYLVDELRMLYTCC